MLVGFGWLVLIGLVLWGLFLLCRWGDRKSRSGCFRVATKLSDEALNLWCAKYKARSRSSFQRRHSFMQMLVGVGLWLIANLAFGPVALPLGVFFFWSWRHGGHTWDAHIAEGQRRGLISRQTARDSGLTGNGVAPTIPKVIIPAPSQPDSVALKASKISVPDFPLVRLQDLPLRQSGNFAAFDRSEVPLQPEKTSAWPAVVALVAFAWIVVMAAIMFKNKSATDEGQQTNKPPMAAFPQAPYTTEERERHLRSSFEFAAQAWPDIKQPDSRLTTETTRLLQKHKERNDAILLSEDYPYRVVQEAALNIEQHLDQGLPVAPAPPPVASVATPHGISTHRKKPVPAKAVPLAVIAISEDSVEQSRKRAVARYPQLGHSGTPLNLLYISRGNSWLLANDPRMIRPNWPEVLVADCIANP